MGGWSGGSRGDKPEQVQERRREGRNERGRTQQNASNGRNKWASSLPWGVGGGGRKEGRKEEDDADDGNVGR